MVLSSGTARPGTCRGAVVFGSGAPPALGPVGEVDGGGGGPGSHLGDDAPASTSQSPVGFRTPVIKAHLGSRDDAKRKPAIALTTQG